MPPINFLEPLFETLQSAAEADGNGTVFDLNGKYASLGLQISGTFVATVNFEGSVDGINHKAIQGVNKETGALAKTATATGIFVFPVTGLLKFRARISGRGSGSVTVKGVAVAIPEREVLNIGAEADTAVTNPASSGSVIAILKGISANLLQTSELDCVFFLNKTVAAGGNETSAWFDVSGYIKKSLLIKIAGSTDMDFEVDVSPDGGTTVYATVISITALAVGNYFRNLEDFSANYMRIKATNNDGVNAATLNIVGQMRGA